MDGRPNHETEQVKPVAEPRVVPAEARVVREPEVRVYAHSRLFYWWPVWVAGYVIALLTHLYGESHQIGQSQEIFYPESNLGVIFLLTLLLVIVITNVTVRGLASVIVILLLALGALALAYFHKWDAVLDWFGRLRIHLNLGAYFWFATMIFVAWLLTVVVFDHMSHWRITPGQVTHEFVLGSSSKSYDADNMVFEKFRDDLFRHWILGFGSGDLRIRAFGAQQDPIFIPNVLLVGSKVRRIEHMIAAKPDR